MTLRTREMRRSALVKVPSFSRNDEPGSSTCAYLAVSLRKMSCTTMHSIDDSARRHVMRVRVRLHDVFALAVEALEGAVHGGVEHVRNAQARFRLQRDVPGFLEQRARDRIADVAVARQFVRERAHVARTLHVVLAAQRIHADAFAADVAGRHREIGDAHHHRRALRVFGDAEAVVDRGVAAASHRCGRLRAPAGPARRSLLRSLPARSPAARRNRATARTRAFRSARRRTLRSAGLRSRSRARAR